MFSARIDEVVSANGELQSPGSERVIKSPFTGEVLAVNVQEGQKVKAGQVLINLNK